MIWDFLQEALRLGAKVSLAALPYSLVYNHLRMFNFAFGEVITFAAYVVLIAVQKANWSMCVALLIAMLLSAALGFVMELIAYRRLSTVRDRHLLLVSSVGVSIALQNLYQAVFGSRRIYLENIHDYSSLVWVSLALELGVLFVTFERTTFGKQVAAIASDQTLAQLLGINPAAMSSAVFAIASALAAPAGFFELNDHGVAPDMGFQLGLLAFAAAVLGGSGSLFRTVLASLLLAGLVQWAQFSGVLSERLIWVICVIGAIMVAAVRRVIRRRINISKGEDTGR
jgi:branched-chain amino acid transport system permease protein